MFSDQAISVELDGKFVIRNLTQPVNAFSFHGVNKEVARIDSDGVFRVKVDPTDENTKAFIEAVNRCLQNGIKLTKVEINGE